MWQVGEDMKVGRHLREVERCGEAESKECESQAVGVRKEER